jgi:type VI secretion system secreted protein VgrG
MPIPENEQTFSNRLDLSEAGQVVADLPHPWANLPYLVTDHTGNILTSGTLDEAGSGSRVFARQAQDVDAWIGTSGWDATEESWNNDASEEMRA